MKRVVKLNSLKVVICNNKKTSKFDVRKILGIARKGKSKPKIKGNLDKNVKNNNN
jgi:hypothetical protein